VNCVDPLWIEASHTHFMNSTTLLSHVWLEIKWHYFQLASVLLRFQFQQVISANVYMYKYDLCYVPVPSLVTNMCL